MSTLEKQPLVVHRQRFAEGPLHSSQQVRCRDIHDDESGDVVGFEVLVVDVGYDSRDDGNDRADAAVKRHANCHPDEYVHMADCMYQVISEERRHWLEQVESGRPNFFAFAWALREEARGTALIHRKDTTGQYASDCEALVELAKRVEAVGDRLGFMSRPKGDAT